MIFKKLLFLAPVLVIILIYLFINYPQIFNFINNNKTSDLITPVPLVPNPPSALKWGVYNGDTINNSIEFKKRVGRQASYLPVFVHWGENERFPPIFSQYATLESQTLLIYWEAMDPENQLPAEDKRFSYKQILNGSWDEYLRSFSSDAQKYNRPVIIVLFEEMNGDWYPWSITKNGNNASEHIAAYRYVRKFFNNANNVKFAWTINSDSVNNEDISQVVSYYPGNNYVDYIGIDGFNFGDPWISFSDIFTPSLTALKKINKPIIITSMACAADDKKASWIQSAAETISQNPQIIGWVWFNEDKEKDWRIWSDSDSLKSFQNYLTTVSNTTHPDSQ